MMRGGWLIGLLAVLTISGSQAAFAEKAPRADLAVELQTRVSATRAARGVPGLGALLIADGRVQALAVAGERAVGTGVAVEKSDLWHIGSNAKAMTATLIARLVEQEALSFDSTMEELFGAATPDMHPDIRGVTIADLLTHTSGIKANLGIIDRIRYRGSSQPAREQRSRLVRELLNGAPAREPGARFAYSNLGYILAGAAAEAVTGEAFETLLEREVFAPLGVAAFGFGAPGRKDVVDQPRGHRRGLGGRSAVAPGPGADNLELYGPAGTVHVSLRDWAKFAIDHLKGPTGAGRLLLRETYERLHSPAVDAGDFSYAMGWGVREDEVGRPFLSHAGSNTMWFAVIRLYPEQGAGVLVAANDGSRNSEAGVRELAKSLAELVLEAPAE